MATEAQKRATRKYDAANTKQYHLKLNTKTDADMIEWIDRLDNFQGYIKYLIKKAMREDLDPNGEISRRFLDHMSHWDE